jgi:hypothetical protein
MRSGFFTKTEEARNSGSAGKTEAALDAVLLLVGPDEFLIGELVRLEHISGDEEGGFALHRAGDRLLSDGHRCLDLPVGAVGRRALAGTPWSVLLGMGHEVSLHPEPLRTLLELLVQRRLRVGCAGEALGPEMPELLLPQGARRLHLPLERLADPLLAPDGADHDPAFSRRGLWG